MLKCYIFVYFLVGIVTASIIHIDFSNQTMIGSDLRLSGGIISKNKTFELRYTSYGGARGHPAVTFNHSPTWWGWWKGAPVGAGLKLTSDNQHQAFRRHSNSLNIQLFMFSRNKPSFNSFLLFVLSVKYIWFQSM